MYYTFFGLSQAPFKITPDTDFFFEGGQPIGQVEASAGRFAGEAGNFLLERGKRLVVAGARGCDGGVDESADAVDREWPGKSFAQTFGDAGETDAILSRQFLEASQF